MSIKVCHGSDVIIENPMLIKSDIQTFGKELGDGFYVFERLNREKALEYAIDSYLYHNRQNNIIINNYEFKIDKFAEEAIDEFENRLLEEDIDLIVSNILRIKTKNCEYLNRNIECNNCNLECPKNKNVVMTLLVDKFLDDKIIGKNFNDDITREKLTNIINSKFNMKSNKIIKQLRIAGNIKNYINFIGYEKIDPDSEEIKILINNRINHLLSL